MCSCYTKIKKTVKFVCFWVIILTAIDAGLTAMGHQFLTAILTPCAQIVVKILAGISALIVLACVTFGFGCCGKRCSCGCEYGCECGCIPGDCKCGDKCECIDKKDTKKDGCCSIKPTDKKDKETEKKS